MEGHPGRGLGGSWMQSFRALSQWGQGASPSQDIDVFTGQEVPPSLGVHRFYLGFMTQT